MALIDPKHVFNMVWEVGTLSWVAMTQPGGGSGGAVTIADGADVAQGSKADVAWVAGDGTVISLLKKIASAGGGAVSIADGSDVAEGATTDVAVQGDNPGTVSAKLRGLNKSIAAGIAVTNANLDIPISTIRDSVDNLGGGANLTDVISRLDPFLVAGAGGYVRQDSTATIAKESGGNLATLASTVAIPGAEAVKAIAVQGVPDGLQLAVVDATGAKESGGNLENIVNQLLDLIVDSGDIPAVQQGPLVQGRVSDQRESYINQEVQPLSLTSDGRLRVSSSPADIALDFTALPELTGHNNPWDISSPWA